MNEQVAAVGDQYMFGPDLLVAPVVNEDTFRTISFPSGVWTSLWDGKTVSGPVKLKVSAPLDTIPVYLKPGAVVPVQLSRELQFGKSMTSGRVNALVVTLPNGDQKIGLLNARGEVAKVTVQSKARRYWLDPREPSRNELSAGLRHHFRFLRKSGWQGVAEVTAASLGSMPAGWAADLAGNRLVIRLPSRQVEQSEPTTEIEVEFKPSKE